MQMLRLIPFLLVLGVPAAAMAAAPAGFVAGPVFTDFGGVATVNSDMPLPPQTRLKVAFMAFAPGKADTIAREFDSAARFINMNVAAGLQRSHVQVAIVVRGPGAFDLTNDARYGAQYPGKTNPNAHAVAELIAYGVDIYMCGQTASGLGIAKADLLPGVQLALSAMDAEVLLHQQGYALIEG